MSGRNDRTTAGESALPERLRNGGGTELEQRLLNAAAREQPSRELFERMALGIGISPPPLAPPENVAPGGADVPPAVAGSRALLPWLSGGTAIAAVVVAAALVTARSSSSSRSAPPAALPAHSAVAMPSAAVAATQPPPPTATEEPRQAVPVAPRNRATAAMVDIQDQIALIDAARSALSAGASQRALELLAQYRSKYPSGSFRPEAAALRIETLAKLGRSKEAQALAQRFISEHPGSPLAERVSRVTGSRR